MSDTYTLELKNFRSIRDVSMDIAPLTVVYGPNGAGKSSLIYGLLTLKNFLTNPNQNLPSLFSYPTLSLGGYNEVVSGHDTERTVSLSLSASTPTGRSGFTLSIGQSGGQSTIDVRAHEVEQVSEHHSLGWQVQKQLGHSIPLPWQSVGHTSGRVDRSRWRSI